MKCAASSSRSSWLKCLLIPFAVIGCLLAQSPPTSRIAQPIDNQVRVTLTGNIHPLAQARYDRGAVADSFPAQRMMLLLQRAPDREPALQQFLQEVHRPGSPSYHRWLTPEQFGKLYAPSDADVASVSAWLQQQGFSVARVTRGKSAIEFSGTAGQVRSAFHTEIHAYSVNGERYYSNNADPQIPAALALVVGGISPLNNFRPQSNLIVLGKGTYDPRTRTVTPEWTISGNPPVLAFGPGDFAVQYDLNPLYGAGLDGTGVTIGIIGASDIDPAAVVNYHTMFGLPPLKFTSVIDGIDTDPNTGNWATFESYLDVEVASSIALGAQINLYTAADTSVQSGLLLAAVRAVDDDQATVLSTSYGECEQGLGTSGNQFWAALWEQAAAQGQTSFVSAGDGGSAGCDNFNLPQAAQYGLAVSGFASSPWNVSVGGTDFYYSSYNGSASAQQTQLGNYWNLNATTQPAVSLMQPIPEQPWNRAFGLNLYDGGIYNPTQNGITIVGGGGGASTVYPKPSWQSGKGVPTDRARDLPDVSLFASDGENDSFWLECGGGAEGCVPLITGGYEIFAVGGTSASTPAMAAIMAIVNQKFGPQGQANFVLYPMAMQHPSVFHDIAISSNNVPCQQGTPNCTVSAANDNSKGFYTLGHYSATAGYDQATGLGSVDANLLVQDWNTLSFKPSTTTLTPSQTTFTHGTPITLDVSVSGSDATPTGDVGLITTASPTSNTSLGEITLKSGAASPKLDNLPGGQYQLIAKYTGDTVYAPSNSTAVPLNVTAEASTVSLTGSYWSNSSNAFVPLASGGSYPYSTYILFDARPQGVNAAQNSLDGLATGAITFTDTVGSSPVNSGALNINRVGIAEWVPTLTFPPGTNSVVASYPGDASFSASTSNQLAFTVTKATPSAFLVSRPSPVAFGSTTQLDFQAGANYDSPLPAPPASTYAQSSPLSPTGTVTFSFGNTVLGTVQILPNYNNLYGSEVTLNVSTLPMGSDTITATYNGDANYNSTTATFNVVVEQAPTVSAVANPSTINQAEYTAITATVAGGSGMATPTGTVSYSITGPGSTWTDTETLRNGSATSAALPGGVPNVPGAATVQVSYSGDSVYGPAGTVATFTVVQGTTLPFSLSATAVTVAAGATSGNTSTLTVTPQGGFTGDVFLSCTLTSSPTGAVHLPTCSVPASVSITGASAATATITVNSTAPTTITTAMEHSHGIWLGIAANGGLAVSGLFLIGCRPRRTKRVVAVPLFLILALGILGGCGGGGNGGGGGTQQVPGTTAGSYTFTVGGAFSANGVSQVQTSVAVAIQ